MCLCKCSNWLHICICMNRKNNNNNNKTCTTLEWAISRSLRWIVTGNYTCMDLYFIFKIQIGFSIKSIPLIRGIPRTHAKCKVDLFVASVNDWKQLTNVTRSSIFSVQASCSPIINSGLNLKINTDVTQSGLRGSHNLLPGEE